MTNGTMPPLIELLEARAGLICAVGAGGKKSTLYHLATSHGGRVGLTCTVAQAPYPKALGAHIVIAPPAELVPAVAEAAAAHSLVAFAHPSAKKSRHAGLSPELLGEIVEAGIFDVLLVKADGARMRWIKAPATDEPAMPGSVGTVIPVVSARAIGQPLTEDCAHRVERLEAITGARRGERLQPEHVARLLASPEGALRRAGNARVIPLINMVDTPEAERHAREAGRMALQFTDRFDRVVLTSLRRDDPLIGVLTR